MNVFSLIFFPHFKGRLLRVCDACGGAQRDSSPAHMQLNKPKAKICHHVGMLSEHSCSIK